MEASVSEKNIRQNTLFLDTHVHLHSCFAIEQIFSGAANNFATQASRLGQAEPLIACLMLTEMQGEDWILRHLDLVKNSSSGVLPLKDGWTLSPTAEDDSLMATHMPSQKRLALLAGRQIVTKEQLEVLALLTITAIPDGLPLEETINTVIAEDGIPVLPWGVGKWIGARGRLVAEYLQRDNVPKVFLGDNSGRPLGWRRPSHFKLSEQRGVPVLPGTDPLPLPTEASKVGSFGLQISGTIDVNYPGNTVRKLLHELSLPVETFGQLEKPWRFMQNQVALRVNKT
jgi:hypothetical protein